MEILLVTFSLNELCAVVVVATVTLSARLLTYGVDEFSILVQGPLEKSPDIRTKQTTARWSVSVRAVVRQRRGLVCGSD